MTAKEYAEINDKIQSLKTNSRERMALIVNATLDAVTEILEEYVEEGE